MKVTLRYSGTLSDPVGLDRLREDFLDIAAIHAWPVDLLEREPVSSRRFGGGNATLAPPLVLAGLKVIVHPQTDPLWLTFDEAGVLTRLGGYALGSFTNPRLGLLHQSQASIQTSIGGVALHRTVVGLLDYLKRAYVRDLDVVDDSGFWQNRDEGALRLLMGGR
ncbi:MAG: hypothetical protein ACREKE_07710 [bacterium]